MRKIQYILLLVFVGCKFQSFNSNSSDNLLGGLNCSNYTSDLLPYCNAQNVIIKKCSSCHSGYHSDYASYSQQDYLDNSLIVAGDSAGSSLFLYLQNEGGTMPKDGSALSQKEYEYIRDWIDSLSSL